jgi:threonine dehydrogenase-like Zn-dependent dehydrogenase
MKAALLVEPRVLAHRDIPEPRPAVGEVTVRLDAVGICGSDIHIHDGSVNWNLGPDGRSVPLARQPQILGHEMVGRVVEVGDAVERLVPGDRVVLDQGINCASRGRSADDWCEYCATGFSHHCIDYEEHGITGLPGGFADCIVLPEVNAIPITGDLADELAVMTEPLGCVIHHLRLAEHQALRYRFEATSRRDRIRTIVMFGLGPSGQLFGRALRRVMGFEGEIIVMDPSVAKRRMAVETFGAIEVDSDTDSDGVTEILDRTGGRGCEMLIDACGALPAWIDFAKVIRKQATAILYGYGRDRGGSGSLDALQWRGAGLVTSSGASGPLGIDGRPELYRDCLEHLQAGRVMVDDLITHRYRRLEDLDRALGTDPGDPDYLKGVLVRSGG